MTDKELVYKLIKDLRNTIFSISDSEAIPLLLDFIKTIRESEDKQKHLTENYIQHLQQKLEIAYDIHLKQANTIEQTLGQALGYPWYKDDQKNFTNATEADGVCTGDHTPESIAMEAANKIRNLENKITNIQQHTSDPLCESQDVDLTHHTSDSPPWTASNIDYRSLFIKYLRYITDEEGTNLIEYTPGFASNVKFTATEWAELQKLNKES